MNVDFDDVADRSFDAVGAIEDPTIVRAITERDDEPRFGHRVQRLSQRISHVLGDRSGHQEGVGVTRRRNESHAKSLRVIDRCEGGRDFKLTAIARAGVDVSHLQRSVKTHWGVLQRRRVAQVPDDFRGMKHCL